MDHRIQKALRVARRLFSAFVGLLLTLSLVISILLFVIVLRPEWALGDPILRRVSKLLKPDIDFSWETLDLTSSKVTLLKRRILLDGENVCAVLSGGVTRMCFQKVSVSAVIDFSKVIPSLVEIGPIALLKGEAIVRPGPSVAPQTNPPESETFSLPTILTNSELSSVRVELDRWVIQNTKGKPSIEGTALLNGNRNGASYAVDLDADTKTKRESAEIKLRLRNDSGPWSLWTWRATLAGRGKLPDGVSGSIEGELLPLSEGREAETTYQTNLKANYSRPRETAKARVSGNISSRETSIKVDGNYHSQDLGKLELKDCLIRASDRGGDRVQLPARFSLDCEAFADLVPTKIIPESMRGLRVVTNKLSARLEARFSTRSYPPSPSEFLAGDLSVRLKDIKSPFVQLSAGASAQVEGVLSEFPQKGQIHSSVEMKAVIPTLQQWVKHYESTSWAVPAPFNALNGRIEVSAKGSSDLNKGGKIPVRFKSRLVSKTQRLDVDAGGTVSFTELRKMDLKLELAGLVDLSDIRLNLPRMNAAVPPRLFPDRRIRKDASLVEEPKPSNVKFDVGVKTHREPIRIASNLTEAPIPIHLNLKMSDSGSISGNVRVHEFPAELFRREARFKFLNLDISEPVAESRIDGRVDVDYTDISIQILMLGSVGKPVVRFTSNPPLPEDQVVAALLFGRRLEQLDSEENASVGDTRAALADSALGLASMYALASTPIESVGYDSTSGEVSARLRLGEGTSLRLGGKGGEGVNQVGIRRRLGSKWTLETEIEPSIVNPQAGASAATATLEWRLRY
jgi:hypothetical protein